MNSKTTGLRVSGLIFGIVALIHLSRLITGAAVLINDWPLPFWVNWMGLAGTSVLCIWLWRLSLTGKE